RHGNDVIGIGVVAERGGIGDVDAGARQINRGVESVAAARHAEPAVAAARQFDHDLANRNHTGFRVGHLRSLAHWRAALPGVDAPPWPHRPDLATPRRPNLPTL